MVMLCDRIFCQCMNIQEHRAGAIHWGLLEASSQMIAEELQQFWEGLNFGSRKKKWHLSEHYKRHCKLSIMMPFWNQKICMLHFSIFFHVCCFCMYTMVEVILICWRVTMDLDWLCEKARYTWDNGRDARSWDARGECEMWTTNQCRESRRFSTWTRPAGKIHLKGTLCIKFSHKGIKRCDSDWLLLSW